MLLFEESSIFYYYYYDAPMFEEPNIGLFEPEPNFFFTSKGLKGWDIFFIGAPIPGETILVY